MKNIKRKIIISGLLLISMILLSVLVPGGPIETRDFSRYPAMVLGGFNTFLTSLGMISLLLVYFTLKQYRWSFITAFICGISYFLTYVLDLGHIFPVSPTPMPLALQIIEVIGMVLSIPLMYLSLLSFYKTGAVSHSEGKQPIVFYIILFVMILIGVGTIIFATKSAMNGM